MPEFIYQEPFPVGEDTTEYRLLTKDYVKVVECDGRKILKVDPKGLEELSKAAYSDVSFYLRASHLQKLRNILEDSEASDNDRFVAYTMLLNQCVAAEGELPTCQDTGSSDADKHFYKIGTGNAEKRNACFSGNRFCQKGFTGSRRTYHQNTFRNSCTQFCIFCRIGQKVNDLF